MINVSKSRRIFLITTATAAAGLSVLKKLFPANPNHRPATAKFLTREGKLVEAPLVKLSKKRIAITKEELMSWVKPK